jgi:hypothetical protein
MTHACSILLMSIKMETVNLFNIILQEKNRHSKWRGNFVSPCGGRNPLKAILYLHHQFYQIKTIITFNVKTYRCWCIAWILKEKRANASIAGMFNPLIIRNERCGKNRMAVSGRPLRMDGRWYCFYRVDNDSLMMTHYLGESMDKLTSHLRAPDARSSLHMASLARGSDGCCVAYWCDFLKLISSKCSTSNRCRPSSIRRYLVNWHILCFKQDSMWKQNVLVHKNIIRWSYFSHTKVDFFWTFLFRIIEAILSAVILA